MTSKSNKTPLIIVVSLALILFVSAYAWKQFKVDNSETVTINTSQKSETKKPKEKTTPKPQPIETTVKHNTEEKVDLTLDERKEKKVKLEKKLNLSLMLKTPEQYMEVITSLQKSGRTDEANKYIEYLLEKFPDYEME
jgi:uncharacterized protein YxeA